MGSISEFFFGSDAELETEQLSTMSPQQQKLLNDLLLPFLSSPLEGEIEPRFPGELTAGQTDLEKAISEALGGQIGGEVGGATDDALLKLLSGDPSDFEEFFQQTIKEPALEDFNEDIIPAINAAFPGANQFFGGQRQKSVNLGTEELIQELTRSRADIGFQTRESALDRMLQAITAGTGRTGATVAAGNFAAGPRQTGQEGIDREFQEFLRVGQGARDTRINQILSALGLDTVENIGFGDPGDKGLISDILVGLVSAGKTSTGNLIQ